MGTSLSTLALGFGFSRRLSAETWTKSGFGGSGGCEAPPWLGRLGRGLAALGGSGRGQQGEGEGEQGGAHGANLLRPGGPRGMQRAMRPVAFATAPAFSGLTADDRLAVDALADLGVAVEPLVWGGPAPAGLEAVVVRSCWDYHLRPRAFLAWLAGLEQAGVALWNPARVLAGTWTSATCASWPAAGCRWRRRSGWSRATSPAARPRRWASCWPGPASARRWSSRGSRSRPHRTFRVRAGEVGPAEQAALVEAAAESGALVQRFLPGVAEGELSLVYLGGALSHAVRKRPAAGDFRVQADFGGVRTLEAPPPEAVEVAGAALGQAPGPLLYARVDLVRDAGQWWLMELELLDPELFLAFEPAAAERLARALVERL